MSLSLKDYDYLLPEKNIAQFPTVPQHNSKLLIYDRKNDEIKIDVFFNIWKFLKSDTMIFLNNSKVIKSRIKLKNVKIVKKTWEILYLNMGEIFIYELIWYNEFECLVSDSKNFRPWTKIYYDDNVFFESISFKKDWILMKFMWGDLLDFLWKNWNMPLPPYISYSNEKSNFYQTEFFDQNMEWSVASPTAWLHFTKKLLDKLWKKFIIDYLTLHVWLWTFKPIYNDDVTKFDIHKEKIILDFNIFDSIFIQKNKFWPIMAVWTTSCRVLESLYFLWWMLDSDFKNKKYRKNTINYWDDLLLKYWWLEKKIILNLEIKNGKFFFDTKIYIYPWFKWKIVDVLTTNFHLPKTSLLLLVDSFIWKKWKRKKIYNFAMKNNFKFYSFWDWMLIL